MAAPAGRDDREVSEPVPRSLGSQVRTAPTSLCSPICGFRWRRGHRARMNAAEPNPEQSTPKLLHYKNTEKFLWAKLIFVGHSKYPRKLGKFRGLGAAHESYGIIFVGLKLAHEI